MKGEIARFVVAKQAIWRLRSSGAFLGSEMPLSAGERALAERLTRVYDYWLPLTLV